jgi:hypothetical protein
MKRIRKLVFVLCVIFVFLFVYTSCRKEVNNSIPQGQQRVSINLTDDPINFNAVNVDIQTVEVQVIPDSCLGRYGDDENHDGDDDHESDHDSRCSVWDTLNIHPGVYNLLHLSNGVDTILANGFTVSGKITKIRLTLGDNNSVVIDSVAYPLILWNNHHRITISIRGEDIDQVSQNDLQLWLDFDAARSIVRIDDNHFVLRPFLRVWLPAHTSTVKGFVLPDSAHSIVAAIFNGDTLVAIPRSDDGFFKIRGITSHSTDLFINATANGYQDTTITGIQLQPGQETDIGTVQLHQ